MAIGAMGTKGSGNKVRIQMESTNKDISQLSEEVTKIFVDAGYVLHKKYPGVVNDKTLSSILIFQEP